jgi:hypothetical protein
MKRLLFSGLLRAYPWLPVYGPAGDGGGNDTAAAGGGNDTTVSGAGNDTVTGSNENDTVSGGAGGAEDDKPKFTQKQLNKILADDRRKHEDRVNQAVKQLEEAKKAKGMSEQDRSRLQEQIEEMKNSLLTKEEQAKKEREKQKKEYEKSLEGVSVEKEFWRGSYAEEVTRNQILGAAIEFDAVRAEQLEELLIPKTRLVEVMDEAGSPLTPRKFTPKIKFKTKNEKDEEIELDLTIKEAVKRMKDEPERFGNLFKSGVVGGLGGNGSAGSGGISGDRPPTDPSLYRQWRKQRGISSRK